MILPVDRRFQKKGENGMFEASHEEVRAALDVVAGYTIDE